MRSWSTCFVAALMLITLTPALPSEAGVDSFVDDNGSRFEAYIETAEQKGLLVGCGPHDRICPNDAMTRGQMVLLLARGVGLQPPSAELFVKTNGTLGGAALSALNGAGIATGCKEGAQCPDRPVTRGEMASLFARAFRWGEANQPDRFVDVEGSGFEDALVNLADMGGLLTCDSPVDRRLCPAAEVRRDEAIFALVTVLGLDPAAIERAEPEPPPIGFGDSFNALSLWDGRAPSYRNRVGLTSAGFNNSGLRVSVPRGSHYGADFHLHLEDTAARAPERLYFRYYLKFDSDWVSRSSGKLPGFSGVYGSSGKGGYQSSPSNPGWSARLMFSPNDGDDRRVPIGYYVYHLGQETRYGDNVRWNQAGRLQPGEWYCLEGQVEMNTPGMADGSLQAWVDGTPALDFSGLEFRRPDEPEITIESFWFNVYYGGKPVPERNLGLTIDEVVVDTHRVGCGAGAAASQEAIGDFNGDGYNDAMSWQTCPEGTCLALETRSVDGARRRRELRDTAWFSLETHRLGAAAGDVDGDGEDELVYRGRCDASTACWRVHTKPGSSASARNWGNEARFSKNTQAPTIGDWNGDGFEDLAYQGMCGGSGNAHQCWRVHPSTGDAFTTAEDWGATPAKLVSSIPIDLNGDDRDDLLYQAACDDESCWYTQLSDGTRFGKPVRAGRVSAAETNGYRLFDFDGNGTEDIISWARDDEGSRIEARFGSANGFSHVVVLAHEVDPIEEVHLTRAGSSAPAQATLRVRCGDDMCVETLFATSGHALTDADHYRTAMRGRLGLPGIT
ncbi:MAG TPA: VCBS repeat-containing protein [Acidimicrobiia bacterium]|nr:VCBS repeat-containing protein [Acidimicrobiia bacterium]